MLGAIIGDIVGSVYEFESDKIKEFRFFAPDGRLTDDSLMTIAVGCALVEADVTVEEDVKRQVTHFMRQIGRLYPEAGYGARFYEWLMSDTMGAYNSFGNGSAMRVSSVGRIASSLEEAERLAKWTAEVTHDHPDGVEGAQAVAAAIYLAGEGKSKAEIGAYISERYYDLDFTLDEIRDAYEFDVTCRGSVPQAIVSFLESEDFEDAIRNAVSLGGDGDTLAAIAGAIAEAYYGYPDEFEEEALSYMDDVILDYYQVYAGELYGQ